MAFRSAASTTSGGASFTATAPAGYIAGDLLIAIQCADDNPSLGFPSGWTQVRSDVVSNGDVEAISWGWTIATGSDSFLFTQTLSLDMSVSIAAYSGISATPIDVTPSFNNPNPATPLATPVTCTAFGITPVDSGCDIVMLAAGDAGNSAQSTWTPGGSLNLRTNSGANYAPTAIADFNQAVAGATGDQTMVRTPTFGSDGFANFVAYLVALQPASLSSNADAALLESRDTVTGNATLGPLLLANFNDRVQETTTTAGTGTLTLGGAVASFQSFANAFPTLTQVAYRLLDGNAWEVGYGTFTTGVLSRDYVVQSSNSNALVSLSGGSTSVVCTGLAQAFDWPTYALQVAVADILVIPAVRQLCMASDLTLVGSIVALGDIAIL